MLIVGSGDAPVAQVYHSNPRFIFKDAPLLNLSKSITVPSATGYETVEWTNDIAPLASAKLPVFYHAGLAMAYWTGMTRLLSKYTDEARKRGIKTRWWGLARQPVWVRRHMWSLVKDDGVDWVGGDDLLDLAAWLRELNGRKRRKESLSGTESWTN